MPNLPGRNIYPVLSLLFASIVWGMVWWPLRLLEEQGLNGLWTVLISYSVTLVAMLLFSWRRLLELKRYPLATLVMVTAIGWCNIAFVMAVIEGSVVRVMLLFYLSPIWTVLLGRFILKEYLHKGVGWLLLLAMLGSLLMLWEPGMVFPWPQERADWLALTAGMCFALANVLVRYLQEVSLTAKILGTWIGVVVVASLYALLLHVPMPDVAVPVVLWAIVLGAFGFLIATYAVQYGITHMPVQRSAVILLFELVVGGVSAALIAGESLEMRDWVGGGLIILAGYLVTLRQGDGQAA